MSVVVEPVSVLLQRGYLTAGCHFIARLAVFILL